MAKEELLIVDGKEEVECFRGVDRVETNGASE
jgi:hypothetical protein